MRRFGLLVMTALLTTATVAAAQPRAARTQPTLDAAAAAILADAKAFVKTTESKPAVSTRTVLQQYQRVGHALLLLAERLDDKASCAELQATFRSIKLDDAIATPERRAETAKVLGELRGKIDLLVGTVGIAPTTVAL